MHKRMGLYNLLPLHIQEKGERFAFGGHMGAAESDSEPLVPRAMG